MVIKVSRPSYGPKGKPKGHARTATIRVHTGPNTDDTIRAISKRHRISPICALMLWAWSTSHDGQVFAS